MQPSNPRLETDAETARQTARLLGTGSTAYPWADQDILKNLTCKGAWTLAVGLGWLSGDGQERYDSANADC